MIKLRFRDKNGSLIPYELDCCPFPIGHIIYNSLASFDPNTIYPNTRWNRYAQGRTLVGVNENETEFNTVGKTGGTKDVTLTVDQMPSHKHTPTISGIAQECGAWYTRGDNRSGINWGMGSSPNAVSMTNTGGGKSHTNLQPYITAYCWVRVS